MKRTNQLYLGLFGITIATILATLIQSFIPAASLLALAGVLILPGLSILLFIRATRLTLLEQILYSSALSVLTLMISGLVSNELFWALGNRHPLAASVQVPWTAGLMLGLLGAAWLRNHRQHSTWSMPKLSAKTLGLGATFLAIPAFSVLGAMSLNNNGSNLFTMIAYGLIAASAVGLVVYRRRVAPWLWAWTIFCMGLALLWSTSLRGMFITGHDVQLEYYVFRLTDASKHWTMANFHDAYNACLSITILPTVLKSLSGIDAIALYKIVYQIFFALCGVGVLGLSRRYASTAVSFVTAFIFITFPTFVTDMPMLTRQEVAFNFFVILLLVMFNDRISIRAKHILMVLFGLGVVLSHYSTTFVMIALLGIAYVLTRIMRLVSRLRHQPKEPLTLTLSFILIVGLSAFAWTGLYTKTGNNITAQLSKIATSLPSLLHPKTSNDSSSYTLFKTTNPTLQQWLDFYTTDHHNLATPVANAAGGFYPSSTNYHLQEIAEPLTPLTPLGQWLGKVGISARVLNLTAKQTYAIGLQIAIIVGAALGFLWRKRLRLNADFIVLAPAGIALLAIQTVLPVIDYGLFRMLQQDLMFLALPIVLTGVQILKWLKVRSAQLRLALVTTAAALSFLVISGFTPTLFGASVGQLPLSNSGFYYDAYYTDSQDIGLATWLKTNYPAGYPINSDTFARMKIMSNAGITTVDGLTPSEISKKSYVVLAGANVTEDMVGLYYHGVQLFYKYPTSFLDNNKNLIYSTNHTRVYH